jgi:hypothetical protein
VNFICGAWETPNAEELKLGDYIPQALEDLTRALLLFHSPTVSSRDGRAALRIM